MADGNTENQDALHSGGQPSGSSGTNPSQPQTYTQDQVNRLLSERHSKLDKQISDITKERDSLKSSHDALSHRISEMERRQRVRWSRTLTRVRGPIRSR